jgi:hypothetical protein
VHCKLYTKMRRQATTEASLRQVIYASAVSDQALLDCLRERDEHDPSCGPDVRLEKSRLFMYDAALQCMSLLHLPGMPRFLDSQEHYNWCAVACGLQASACAFA